MGAYYHETRTILIHPALDRAEVPRYFVELVVFHEMLHQAVPQERSETGRRNIHSDEFRRREALFRDFERAFDGVVTQLSGKRFEMSARHLVSAGLVLAPAHGFTANLVVRFTGDRYLDKRNRALAEPFTTVDAGVGYRLERYEFRLDAHNLSDARDPVSESEVGDAQYYRMTARDVSVSLGIRF